MSLEGCPSLLWVEDPIRHFFVSMLVRVALIVMGKHPAPVEMNHMVGPYQVTGVVPLTPLSVTSRSVSDYR